MSRDMADIRLKDLPEKTGDFSKKQSAGPRKQDVVILYAFDCSSVTTTSWETVDRIYWMVQEKLTQYIHSCLGFLYFTMEGDTYTTFDMKLVDTEENMATGYKTSSKGDWKYCTENIESGLQKAQEMIRDNHGYGNGVILLFSDDGLIHKEDFFDVAEEFEFNVPVHTFTLGGDKYNKDLRAIADKSKGTFHDKPVPERPMLFERFPLLVDSIINGTTFKEPCPGPETGRLNVVLVYAFDCTDYTPAWYTTGSIFWMLQERLTGLKGSSLGYIYPMLTPNEYTTDMKVVDREDSKATDDYTPFDERTLPCTKDMASGLKEANKMLADSKNGIILFFSDGSINEGDFFDGTEDFKSEFPVHTFTLGGDAYNEVLQAIADKSGGTFDPIAVPEGPEQSVHFSQELDSLLSGPKTTN